MKVEAKKTADGLLIPMLDVFKSIGREKILLEVKIIDAVETIDYSPLDWLIGLCETGKTDASVEHDAVIYLLVRAHG
ncbi:MAG: hypothetical protein GY862_33860 [Gammaproteobacteria bacterium]|nr:hypothetical protein [Gammaproteobacteria bacterium]